MKQVTAQSVSREEFEEVLEQLRSSKSDNEELENQIQRYQSGTHNSDDTIKRLREEVIIKLMINFAYSSFIN